MTELKWIWDKCYNHHIHVVIEKLWEFGSAKIKTCYFVFESYLVYFGVNIV